MRLSCKINLLHLDNIEEKFVTRVMIEGQQHCDQINKVHHDSKLEVTETYFESSLYSVRRSHTFLRALSRSSAVSTRTGI